jgi:hypothetical protein
MRKHAVSWVYRRIRMLTHGGSDTLSMNVLLDELTTLDSVVSLQVKVKP